MATAPSMALETPDGEYLPPIVSLRQQAVILQKGVRITEIKVGANGNCLEQVEFWIDSDSGTKIKLEKAPWAVGTAHGHKIIDTADPFWQPGRVYYIGFRAMGEQDDDVNGRHPGFNCIPVTILTKEPFRLAVTSASYRQNLVDLMGSYPSIGVSRIVTPDGRVEASINPEQDMKRLQLAPNQPIPVMENESSKTLNVGPAPISQAPGIVQPNQPITAQQNEGLKMRVFVRDQEVQKEIRLTRNEAASTPFKFKSGELTSQTALALFDQSGKLLFPGKNMPGRTREFLLGNVQSGVYRIHAAAKGADNSFGEQLQIKVTVK